MFGSKLSLLVALSLTCACLAFDDMTGMIKVFCDAPGDAYDRAQKCLENLPETYHNAQTSCMEEVAGAKEHDEFKKALCDNNKDVATEMRACLFKKAGELEYELTSDDAIKGLETVNCIRKIF